VGGDDDRARGVGLETERPQVGACVPLPAQQSAQGVVLPAAAGVRAQPVPHQIRHGDLRGAPQDLGCVRRELPPVGRGPQGTQQFAAPPDGDDQPFRFLAPCGPVDHVAGRPQGAQQSAAAHLGNAPFGDAAAENGRLPQPVGVAAGGRVGDDPELVVLDGDGATAVTRGDGDERVQPSGGRVPRERVGRARLGERGRRAQQFDGVVPVRPVGAHEQGDTAGAGRVDDRWRRPLAGGAKHQGDGPAPSRLADGVRCLGGIRVQAGGEQDAAVVGRVGAFVADDHSGDLDVEAVRGQDQAQDAVLVVVEQATEGERSRRVRHGAVAGQGRACMDRAYERLPGSRSAGGP
jgi:hypothetical protein